MLKSFIMKILWDFKNVHYLMRTNVKRKSEKCKSGDKIYVIILLHSNHTEWPTPKLIGFASGIQLLERMWTRRV